MLITTNQNQQQQIVADSTLSYAKKLKEVTINQVVSDLIMAKGNSGRPGYKQYSEHLDALHKCGIDITIDALYKRVEQEYKRRKIINETLLTNSSSLHSTLTGDSGHDDSTSVTNHSAGN